MKGMILLSTCKKGKEKIRVLGVLSRLQQDEEEEMKWNEKKWKEMKWNEMKWNEMKRNEKGRKWKGRKERTKKERTKKEERRRRKERKKEEKKKKKKKGKKGKDYLVKDRLLGCRCHISSSLIHKMQTRWQDAADTTDKKCWAHWGINSNNRPWNKGKLKIKKEQKLK